MWSKTLASLVLVIGLGLSGMSIAATASVPAAPAKSVKTAKVKSASTVKKTVKVQPRRAKALESSSVRTVTTHPPVLNTK